MSSVEISASDTAKKAVIGSLLNKADPASKKVISSYNFTASYKVNLDKMKAHNATLLESCASYLGFKVRDGDKKLYRNQKILCDRLILKIESLFDIQCKECKETYHNELQDTPLFRCQLCLQGSHNCPEMLKKADALKDLQSKGLIPPGTTWLCYECLKKNDLALLPPPKLTKDKQADSAPSLLPIEEEGENAEEEEDRVSPRRGRKDTVTEDKRSSRTCKLYVQRKCPHGLTGKRLVDGKPCTDQHPRQCRFFARFGNDKQRGCKKGRDCNFFHPKLCNDSVNTRCCLNKDCTFHHLKGTARKAVNLDEVQTRISRQPQVQYRDSAPDNRNWPPLRTVSIDLQQAGSLQSLYTPYPPTVNINKAPQTRRESTSDKDKAFLEKLMENLKDGIISQMDAKISELQNQIPALVQEAQLNQQIHRSRQDSHQSTAPHLIQRAQAPQAMPFNAAHPLQMQMPINYIPNFQGSCY